MDTPPYSDISAQLSPGAHAVHVNSEHLSSIVGLPNGVHGAGQANGSDPATVDLRALYSASWSALQSPPPPTLREILTAYKQKGDGDRDMLLAMLNAKSAEDQRIASQLSLRRSMIEINKYTIESRSPSQFYPHVSHPQDHEQHVYTYVPDEPYALAGTNHHHHQQHRIAPASPSALPHAYSPNYPSSSHRDSSRTHAHLHAVESPPLSSVTHKSVLSNTRMRTSSLQSHSRSAARSQTHAIPPPQSQIQTPSQGQSQRRKRPRHSRSRSRSPPPTSSSSSHHVHAYTYTRSPTIYERTGTHSHTHSEVDAEVDRSPYCSASDSGSSRGHNIAHIQGQGQSHNYPRTMAIGSLLTAGAKSNMNTTSSTNSRLNGSSPNGASTSAGADVVGRVKKEWSEPEQDMEHVDELEDTPPPKNEESTGQRGSRDER